MAIRNQIFTLVLITLINGITGKVVIHKREGIPPPDPPKTRATVPDWGSFVQNLDHFNPFDERTWEMRYLNSSEFFQEGGPIFVYLGGEWTITPSTLMTGQIYDMAQEHNGYMFYTEHRFYGQSYPLTDYSTESLRYLTTDLALEDVAHFIAYQKSLDVFVNSRVVVIGGSYSATLATWMRKKYPHLVDIAYSSSAPLKASADFYEYLEVVNDAIVEADSTCRDVIAEAILEVETLLTTPDGVTQLHQDFNICDPLDLNAEPERSYFFGTFTWTFSGIVQYASNTTIPSYCNYIHGFNGTSYQKIVAFIGYYYGNDCLGGYEDFISAYNTSELTTDASRQWYYQTCTEYGWYQTSASENQPFGQNHLIDFYYKWCVDLYGIPNATAILNNGVHRTNLIYGHVEPVVTKVVSVHGTIDPWHAMGVLQDINVDAPTIVVQGASHCKDLTSADETTDTPQLYAAKVRVKRIIAGWLGAENVNDTTTTTESTSATTNTTILPTTPAPGNPGGDVGNVQTGSVFVLLVLLLFGLVVQ